MADKIRFRKVDDSNIEDHARLRPEDNCLFLREYTIGRGFAGSETNNLISNLKKKPSERTTKGGWQYKGLAIRQCIRELRDAINPAWLAEATLVPVPGSKAVDDPDYDDRMLQICRGLGDAPDVRPLVVQTQSTARAHEAAPGERITVEELLAIYEIDETLSVPAPRQIGIFDDVLTAGTHFRAMHSILSGRFPEVPITGIFIARRIFPDDPSDP